MSLGDVMSAFRLHLFAEAGLVLFGAAFLVIGLGTFLRRNRPHFERARHLPLEEDAGAPRQEERATHE